MLNVSDNPTDRSYAYIRKDFSVDHRANVELEFEITPNIPIIRDTYIAVFKGANALPLVGIIYGEDCVKLKVWNYNTYTSQKLYPSKKTYPKGTRRTFPPFYPSHNIRPDQIGLYPPFFSEYPTVAYSGENLNYFPGHSQPTSHIVVNSLNKTYIRLSVSRINSISSEVYLYAEELGRRGREVYDGPLNWKYSDVKTVDLGCVYSNQTPYDFSIENILMNGDVPSEDWYFIRDYDGFKDNDEILWEGALDIDDPLTYSEPTDLVNLARYDYARAYDDSLLTEDPKGIKWVMP